MDSDQALSDLDVSLFDTKRYHLYARESSCDIRISGMTYNDSGTWSCHLETEAAAAPRSHDSDSFLQVFNPGHLDIDVFLEPFEVTTGGQPYLIQCAVNGSPAPIPRLSAVVSTSPTSDTGSPEDRELLLAAFKSNSTVTSGTFLYKPRIADNSASVVCQSEQLMAESVIPESRLTAAKRIVKISVPPAILTPKGPVSRQCYQSKIAMFKVTGYPLPNVNDIHLTQLESKIRYIIRINLRQLG